MHLTLLILTSLLALTTAIGGEGPFSRQRNGRHALTKRPEIRALTPRRTVCRGCHDCPCPPAERPWRHWIPFLASSSIPAVDERRTKLVTDGPVDDAVMKRQLVLPWMLTPHHHEGPRSIDDSVGESQTKPVADVNKRQMLTPVQRLPPIARHDPSTPFCADWIPGCIDRINGEIRRLPFCNATGVCFYRHDIKGPTIWIAPDGTRGVKDASMVRSEHEGTVAQRGHHEPITEPMDRH
jgi:hypothetical protein